MKRHLGLYDTSTTSYLKETSPFNPRNETIVTHGEQKLGFLYNCVPSFIKLFGLAGIRHLSVRVIVAGAGFMVLVLSDRHIKIVMYLRETQVGTRSAIFAKSEK